MDIAVRVVGLAETNRALRRLAQDSPAAAKRAIARTVGVARKRVIKSVARAVGVSQRVLSGGRRGAGGYIKQVRDRRRRPTGALIALVEGVRFSKLRRKRLGATRRKPGGISAPFSATMKSGHNSLFERVSPQTRVSAGNSVKTRRKNLPIREVVVPLQPHAERAMRVHMERAARTVLPAKVWEEIRKRIRSAR